MEVRDGALTASGALTYFAPHRVELLARARGCCMCTSFLGQFYGGHLVCEPDGGRQVIGTPRDGCSFWMRAVGADDDCDR
jgi:hypothetical protein